MEQIDRTLAINIDRKISTGNDFNGTGRVNRGAGLHVHWPLAAK